MSDADPARRRAIWSTLTWVLDRYLRLLHPLMPHLTEEIWGRLPHLAGDPDLLIVARWPQVSDTDVAVDAGQSAGVAELLDLITAIRAARAESGIEAAEWLPARIWFASAEASAAGATYVALESAVGRLARIRPQLAATRDELDAGSSKGLAVITASGEARLERSDADREKERGRLDKELQQVRSQLAAAESRLSDHNFVSRAPADVVKEARNRAAELREHATALEARTREV